MNGPVFCAAVISRADWSSPASLIGHSDMVQVAAYNPLIFVRDASQPPSMTNVCSLLAICSQGTVSLWFTDLSQPFAVLTDLFDRDVLDLSWSKDGKQLWASSSDGQIAVATFEYAEFAPVAPEGTRELLYRQYGYTPRNRPLLPRPVAAVTTMANGTSGGGGTVHQPNALVARKGPGAKRPRTIVPQAAPVVASAAFMNAPVAAGPAPSMNAYASTSAAAAAAPGYYDAPLNARKRRAPPPDEYPYYDDEPPLQEAGYGSAQRFSTASHRLQGHTLGRGDPAPDPLRELVPAYAKYNREVTFRVTNKGKEREGDRPRSLAVPAVMSVGKLGVEDSDAKDTLEWRNFADGPRASLFLRVASRVFTSQADLLDCWHAGKGEAEVTVVTTKKPLWTDYVPRYVVAAAGSPVFTAVSLEDGSLVAWSPTGRRCVSRPVQRLEPKLTFCVLPDLQPVADFGA